MNVTPHGLGTPRELFQRAQEQLDIAISKYQDIAETQEVTIYGRSNMEQRELVQNLRQGYADMFTAANAADALMHFGIRDAGDALPESMVRSMREHLTQLRTDIVAMDTYRTNHTVGTASFSLNGMATTRGDAETAAILLQAIEG